MPSTRLTITPKDLGKFERKLARSELRKAIVVGQREAAVHTLALLKERTMTAPPASPNGSEGAYDKGGFYAGWKVESKGRWVYVKNVSPHAVFVERGRRKNKPPPPVSAILPWVRRKLALKGKAAKTAAFLIARAIGRRGLRGRRIIATSLPAIDRIHTRYVREALQRALKESGR